MIIPKPRQFENAVKIEEERFEKSFISKEKIRTNIYDETDWLNDANGDGMNAFALEDYFSWRFSNTTFLAIGFLLFLQYKMFSLKTDSGNCGRTFIWLTIQDNLLLPMRAMISCTSYGQQSL